MKPLCYISSPYTEGDQVANAAYAMRVVSSLAGGPVIPLSPLAMVSMQLVVEWSHAQWMQYDLDLLSRCQCMIVYGTEDMIERSAGVQAEMKFARDNGIPLFGSRYHLYAWAQGQQ